MSIWAPSIEGRDGPKYIAIADAIAADITSGRLRPGGKLPPHRDLAWRLGVTVGTVARAYAEAERRGLVAGQVGRGTFVRDPDQREPATIKEFFIPGSGEEPSGGGALDLAINRPCDVGNADAVAEALRRMAVDADLPALLPYRLDGADSRHRAAGASWLAREGVETVPERVVVSSGGQQAIVAAIAACTRPGDSVLTECFTYPGFKSTLSLLDRHAEPLPMDDYGIVPEALEAALAARRARVIYTIPTFQNPTTITIPEERRRQVAAIARRHDAVVIEDGVYVFLAEAPPPPIASFAPENTLYITTLSKSVAPAMRTGFIAAPSRFVAGLNAAISASSIMPSPLLVEASALMILSGKADELVAAQKAEMNRRHALADRILGPLAGRHGESFNIWLALPQGWRADRFVADAYRKGVAISPAGSFAIGRNDAQCVRISLSGPATRRHLAHGLRTLADLLNGPPQAMGGMI